MTGLLLNILLAIVWTLFSGEFSVRELIIGFLLGFGLLAVFPEALGTRRYTRTSLGLLRFTGFFLRELTVANVQVALLALRSHPPLNPIIFDVPVRIRSNAGQTLLVAIVCLTPGSVVMGFSADRRTMYVHAIGLENLRLARQSVAKVEDALLNILPGSAVSPEVRP